MWWAMPKIACSPALEPIVLVSIARAAAVGYSLPNWLTSSQTIRPNTPPQIRAPRVAPRAARPAATRPGWQAARSGRRMLIVSADIEGHLLPGPRGRLGAVPGEEQFLQRRLPAEQLGDP